MWKGKKLLFWQQWLLSLKRLNTGLDSLLCWASALQSREDAVGRFHHYCLHGAVFNLNSLVKKGQALYQERRHMNHIKQQARCIGLVCQHLSLTSVLQQQVFFAKGGAFACPSILPALRACFLFSFGLWILKAFCSHPALTFILAVTSSCLMHLPWSFFLNPFQHQQQKIVIHFHSVRSLKKCSFFFHLAAPVFPEYLLFGVFFLFFLWFNTLNYLKQTNKKLKCVPSQLGNINLLYWFHKFTKINFLRLWLFQSAWTQSR